MQSRPSSRKRVNAISAAEAVIDRLGRVAAPGELGALFAKPRLQLDDQGPATLLAHAQTFQRRKAVDLAFDSEQDIDALDRLGRDRRLVSRARSKNLRLLWAQHAASMIGPALRLACTS
jgi:hypothetical protein